MEDYGISPIQAKLTLDISGFRASIGEAKGMLAELLNSKSLMGQCDLSLLGRSMIHSLASGMRQALPEAMAAAQSIGAAIQAAVGSIQVRVNVSAGGSGSGTVRSAAEDIEAQLQQASYNTAPKSSGGTLTAGGVVSGKTMASNGAVSGGNAASVGDFSSKRQLDKLLTSIRTMR